jgi:hypothetical protein
MTNTACCGPRAENIWEGINLPEAAVYPTRWSAATMVPTVMLRASEVEFLRNLPRVEMTVFNFPDDYRTDLPKAYVAIVPPGYYYAVCADTLGAARRIFRIDPSIFGAQRNQAINRRSAPPPTWEVKILAREIKYRLDHAADRETKRRALTALAAIEGIAGFLGIPEAEGSGE